MIKYSLTAEEINLPVRIPDGHKGTFGTVCVFAGSSNMNGACFLCGKAAYKMGAGLVHIFCVRENEIPLKCMFPEAVLHIIDYDELIKCDAVGFLPEEMSLFLHNSQCVIIGPGIGVDERSHVLTRTVVANCTTNLVIDADALNCISDIYSDFKLSDIYKDDNIHHLLSPIRERKIVITPHPKELSRLLHCDVKTVLEDYENIVVKLAAKFKIVVLGKSHHTLVSDGERVYLNQTGNTALATGGSGDVLSGIIAGLIAMGEDVLGGAVKGAFLHGLSGELASDDLTQYSVMASDIIDYLPKAIKKVL